MRDDDFRRHVQDSIDHTRVYGSDEAFRRRWLGLTEESWNLRAQQIRAFGAFLGSVTRTLSGWRILDLGCGDGTWLRTFLEYDARVEDVVGIDISDIRFGLGHAKNPAVRMHTYDGQHIPYDQGSFDLVTQFVCFSNIPSLQLRQHVASEVRRVVKPGGFVFWWDLPRTTAPTDFNSRLEVEQYFDWPIRRSEVADLPLPSETIRPLRGMRRFIAPIVDLLGYRTSHVAALIGPKRRTGEQ